MYIEFYNVTMAKLSSTLEQFIIPTSKNIRKRITSPTVGTQISMENMLVTQ